MATKKNETEVQKPEVQKPETKKVQKPETKKVDAPKGAPKCFGKYVKKGAKVCRFCSFASECKVVK